MDNVDSLMWLGIGGVFAVFGIFTIIRRSAEIDCSGKTGMAPLSIVRITGRGAVVLGVMLVVGGTLLGASFLFYWLGDLFSSDFFFSIPVIGIVIIFTGIMVSPILSTSPPDVRHRHKRKRPAKKTDDAGNVLLEIENPQSDNQET